MQKILRVKHVHLYFEQKKSSLRSDRQSARSILRRKKTEQIPELENNKKGHFFLPLLLDCSRMQRQNIQLTIESFSPFNKPTTTVLCVLCWKYLHENVGWNANYSDYVFVWLSFWRMVIKSNTTQGEINRRDFDSMAFFFCFKFTIQPQGSFTTCWYM